MGRNETDKFEDICRGLLKNIGEDANRQGLVHTPERFARAWEELTSGYRGALFNEKYSEMVVLKHIEFYSLCEHHLLPFIGHVSVAYVPKGKVLGISKIPRIVNMYARRLQLQERLTEQIADALNSLLKPQGVACYIRAQHLCMLMRGVKSQASVMVTSSMRGCFLSNQATRAEFMDILKTSGPQL
jgi:GTP cyclohydrolase IA